jgi:hypothetical protein
MFETFYELNNTPFSRDIATDQLLFLSSEKSPI